MLDFAHATAAKLNFDFEFEAPVAAPNTTNLQKSYRQHRQARTLHVSPRNSTADNMFAAPGTTLATELLELEPQNIFA